MADALAALVLPGTPLLLPGVDPGEAAALTQLRDTLRETLAGAARWILPVPGATVPVLLSLGGLGVDRGARVRPDETAGGGLLGPDDLLSGPALAAAVASLTAAEAALARNLDTASVVAALLAADSGAEVRLRPAAAGRLPLGAAAPEEAPVLLPIDFSAAAHPDAPLAPREGARAFDESLERALTGDVDADAVRTRVQAAGPVAAWLDALARADLAGTTGTTRAGLDLHCVHYRVIELRRTAAA